MVKEKKERRLTLEEKLTTYLLANQLVSKDQIKQLQNLMKTSNKSLISLLLEYKILTSQRIDQILQEVSGYPALDPFKALEGREVDASLFELVPVRLAFRLKVFPVELKGDVLHIIAADPTDPSVLNQLEFYTNMKIEFSICNDQSILKAINHFYPPEKGVDLYIVADKVERTIDRYERPTPSILFEPVSEVFTRAFEAMTKGEIKSEKDVPISEFLEEIIERAVLNKVSDIHLDPLNETLRIRFRKDGILQTQIYLPKRIEPLLVNRIKVLAGMDVADSRSIQSGQFVYYTRLGDFEVTVRTSSIPAYYGEAITMRLLNKQYIFLDLKLLGLEEREMNIVLRRMYSPFGLILASGPTGSGKTTTLYAILDRLNTDQRKIATVEDPIEYLIPGALQVQTNPRKDISFASALRTFYRQNPDVILVGEILDSETAKLAIDSSLTGHLILSSIHANDAVGVILRLISMGCDPFLISAALQMVIAQRLVRRICTHCKKEVEIPAARLLELGFEPAMFEGVKFFTGTGCKLCNHTGYNGQIGVFEVMEIDEDLREAIVKGADAHQLRDLCRKKGMPTLRDNAIAKVKQGISTLKEVLRVTI